MNNEFNSDLHVMVDLETLGDQTDAVITQIAAVCFNPITGETFDTFNMFIDIKDSLDKGFKVSKSTLLWWLEQDEDPRKILLESQLTAAPIIDVLEEFDFFLLTNFMDKLPLVKLWGNGATFDINKMKTHYDVSKLPTPWEFYNERDLRTIVAFNPSIKKNFIFSGVKHDGLTDCYNQIAYMSETLKSISVKWWI